MRLPDKVAIVTGGAESLKRVIPFGRLGTAEDLAPVVVFLASDESGFVTGQTLSVSGGLTMV
jgi:2-hydroxycyclohexanecarboxyl-CoA dehydrogenase